MKVFGKRLAQLFSLSLAVLLLCSPAFSQLNLGRLSGTVTDESGGIMANAKVTVTDQDRGVTRALTSDEAGAYAAPSLTPGLYSVRVEAAGFNISERKDILVQVGGDARVDIVMKAGSQTQTITVSEDLPLVNTTSATLGGVMEGKEVTALPFIGRSYQSLLQFTPGVVTRPGGGSNGHSSNGLRSDGNNWLFEGIFSGGVRTAGSIVNTNSNTGDGASIVPPDAIQEFGVSFQNKAEYGWKPGVASNVGIKSGTNTIHGTAFAVGQTSALNARNPFVLSTNPKPLLAYEQYGATVGGPIKKDKLFYYVAFEGMQFTQGTPTTHVVPTTALVAGDPANSIPAAYLDMKSKAPGGTLPGSNLAFNPAAVDASGNVNSALLTPSQQLSAKLVGLGLFQNGLAPGNVFSYGFTSSRSPNKNLIGKIDWHLSDKNQIAGEYFIARDNEYGNTQSVTQPYWGTYYFLTGNVARASWTYLPNSRWVNEAHFGFDRKVENSWPGECSGNGPAAPDYGVNSGAATPCIGSGTPTAFSLPVLTISGFDALSAGTTQQRRVEGYWSVVDNVSYTEGNHNIKFGVELRRPYLSGASYSGERGSVSFGTSSINAFTNATPLESFLMGVPSTGSLLFGDPTVVMRNYDFGSFVQDDWRITPRLTINMGLRYEYETAITEDNNKLAQFDPTLGMTQLGANGFNSLWNSQKIGWNLQPRLGAVWDVTGKGTTVVRAAYGIYSSWPVWQVPLTVAALGNNPTAAALYNTNGSFTPGTGTIGAANVTFATAGGTTATPVPVPALTWTTAGPIFPTGSLKCGNGLAPVNPVAGAPATNPGTCAVGEMDQNWKLPYVREWTLGIQHAISSGVSLDVAYVGNHGTRLLGATDANMPTMGTNAKAREQQSRPFYSAFPWMAKLTDVQNLSYSNYNALQATLTQRSWHGLTSTIGYTFSHTLDSTQTDITQNVYPAPNCTNCNYGPTGFDVRHRMTIRATYLIPGKKGFGQMMEGWQLSSLVNLIGALPYNVSDTTSDLSGTGESNERWNLMGNASDFNGYGRFVSIPCFGISTSTFGKSPACTSVANLAAMPQACQTAASQLPTNPTVPSSDPNSTGTKALQTFGCYMVGNSVIVPPAQGTVGNMGPNMMRGGGLRLWDFSVRKKIIVTERIGAEFQFDMYNVTNSPQFASPSGTNISPASPALFGSSGATPNVSNGNVVQGTGDARRYQFGLHLNF